MAIIKPAIPFYFTGAPVSDPSALVLSLRDLLRDAPLGDAVINMKRFVSGMRPARSSEIAAPFFREARFHYSHEDEAYVVELVKKDQPDKVHDLFVGASMEGVLHFFQADLVDKGIMPSDGYWSHTFLLPALGFVYDFDITPDGTTLKDICGSRLAAGFERQDDEVTESLLSHSKFHIRRGTRFYDYFADVPPATLRTAYTG